MNTIEPLAISPAFNGEVTIPETALAQRAEILKSTSAVQSVASAEELESAVAALRELTAALKSAEDARKAIKKPFIAINKTIDATHEEFVTPLEKDKARISEKVNAYQRAEYEREQKEARRLADEQRKAQEEPWKAQAEIRRQQEEIERKKRELESTELSKKQRAEAERLQKEAAEKLQAAQLKQEEAALTQQGIESQLAAPTDTPKGLTQRVRYDFQVLNLFTFIESLPSYAKIADDKESLKLDRAGMIRDLNSETPNTLNKLLPSEEKGETEARIPACGLRIFLDLRTNVRA